MDKKRVNLMLPVELNDKLGVIAKKFGWTKSKVVCDMLQELLPYLEKLEPHNVVTESLKMISKSIEELNELIETTQKK